MPALPERLLNLNCRSVHAASAACVAVIPCNHRRLCSLTIFFCEMVGALRCIFGDVRLVSMHFLQGHCSPALNK